MGQSGHLLQRRHHGSGSDLLNAPAQAAFELPEGEKITNLPAIPRAMPQKEAYELYDPDIGKNFDLKNFWMRADLRVQAGNAEQRLLRHAIHAGLAVLVTRLLAVRNARSGGSKANDFYRAAVGASGHRL